MKILFRCVTYICILLLAGTIAYYYKLSVINAMVIGGLANVVALEIDDILGE